MFSGLVVGIEEIVVVWITIELEHFSYEFAVVLPLLRATYSPAAVDGIVMRSVWARQWTMAPDTHTIGDVVVCLVSVCPARSQSVLTTILMVGPLCTYSCFLSFSSS